MLQNFQTTAARHKNIEQKNIPFTCVEAVESFLGSASLPKFSVGKFLGEDLFEAFSQHRMIVGD